MSVTYSRRPPAPARAHAGGSAGGLLDPKQLWRSTAGRAAQAQPGHAVAQPGHVHRRDRRGLHHRARDRRPERVRLGDHGLAVAHRALRQPRRGGRRGPRQGPGGDAARGPRRTPSPAALSGWAEGAAASAYREERVPAAELQLGDIVVVEAGQIIPGDGDVVEGIASVDESAITGESAPVIRESGGDRSARSPAAPRCSPTGSSCGSPRSRARASSTG